MATLSDTLVLDIRPSNQWTLTSHSCHITTHQGCRIVKWYFLSNLHEIILMHKNVFRKTALPKDVERDELSPSPLPKMI